MASTEYRRGRLTSAGALSESWDNAFMRPHHFLSLRLIAAILVLFAHSFALSGQLPMGLLTIFPALAGSAVLGVNLFFIISGYLISQSWWRHPSVGPFIFRRIIRIFPGLIVCLAITIAIGSIFTSLAFSDYWRNAGLAEYFLRNILLQNFLLLPGLFTANPVGGIVNGSLWTISIEVACYLFVLLMGMLVTFNINWRTNLGLFAALVLAIAYGEQLNLFGAVVFASAIPGYLAAFIFGALNFVNRSWLPQSLPWASVALIIYWIASSIAANHYVGIALLSYFTINLARVLGIHWPERPGAVDLSFGIYIYAFPIQQVLVQVLPNANGWVILAMTLPICLLLAALSWFLVESPALGLKRQLSKRTNPTN